MILIEELIAERINRERFLKVGEFPSAIELGDISQSFYRGFVLSLLVTHDIRETLGRGATLLEVADIRQPPMTTIIKDGNGAIDIVF